MSLLTLTRVALPFKPHTHTHTHTHTHRTEVKISTRLFILKTNPDFPTTGHVKFDGDGAGPSTCVRGVLTSWLLLLGLISDSLTRDDLISAKSPSSSEWLISAKICSFCGSPSSLNGIISSVAQSSGSPPPPPPDNCGISRVIESPPHPTNARKAKALDRKPPYNFSWRTPNARASVWSTATLENPEGTAM